MNKEDRDQVREIIQDTLRAHKADTDAMFTIISERLKALNSELEGTNRRWDIQNGRVARTEQSIVEINQSRATRELTCPFRDDVGGVRTKSAVVLGVKSLIVGAVTIISLIIGTTIGTITLYEKLTDKVPVEQSGV